jgi:hypothetical protein
LIDGLSLGKHLRSTDLDYYDRPSEAQFVDVLNPLKPLVNPYGPSEFASFITMLVGVSYDHKGLTEYYGNGYDVGFTWKSDTVSSAACKTCGVKDVLPVKSERPTNPLPVVSGGVFDVQLTDQSYGAPGLSLKPIPDQRGLEGANFTVAVSATESGVGRTLSYSLDAGAPGGAHIDPNTGVFTWTSTAPGRYPVTVRVTDNGSPPQSDAQTFTITVNNVVPTVNAGLNASIVQGTTLTRSGSFVDPGSEVWTATVDYGDGTAVRPLSLNPDKTFLLDHAYTSPGSYVVTVSVDDGVGGLGTNHFVVNVAAASSGFGRRRDAFVTTLYRDQLGRFPEPQGLHYWSGKLASGMRRWTVASEIGTSPEHRRLARQHVAPAITLRHAFIHALRAWHRAGRVSHPSRRPSTT